MKKIRKIQVKSLSVLGQIDGERVGHSYDQMHYTVPSSLTSLGMGITIESLHPRQAIKSHWAPHLLVRK